MKLKKAIKIINGWFGSYHEDHQLVIAVRRIIKEVEKPSKLTAKCSDDHNWGLPELVDVRDFKIEEEVAKILNVYDVGSVDRVIIDSDSLINGNYGKTICYNQTSNGNTIRLTRYLTEKQFDLISEYYKL